MLFVVTAILLLSSAWSGVLSTPQPCHPSLFHSETRHDSQLARKALERLNNWDNNRRDNEDVIKRVTNGGSAAEAAITTMCVTLSKSKLAKESSRYGCADKRIDDAHWVLCIFE